MIPLAPDLLKNLRVAASATLSEIKRKEDTIAELMASIAKDKVSYQAMMVLLGESDEPATAEDVGNIKFRDLIRDAVRPERGVMSIGQVVLAVTATGYKPAPDAKTPLSTKVGNELGRLVKLGEIVKEGRDGYRAP